MGFLRRSAPAAPAHRPPDAPIPLTVLGGYLGAGKTTLLNRLLADPRGRRLGVIVNDVGDISIDTALVAESDGDTIGLTNGCVCCSLADGFVAALDRLREPGRSIDHVVVEVSGVGDPWKVAQWGRTPGFVLDTVVVLADAETIVDRVADPHVGETVLMQLAGADVVLLTHLDLAEDPDRVVADLTGWLGERTVAPVVTEAAAIIEGITSPDPGHLATLGEARRADSQAHRRPRGEAGGHGGAHDHPDHDGHGEHAEHLVVTAETTAALTATAWKAWLGGAPTGVVRVKGFVSVNAATPTSTDPDGAVRTGGGPAGGAAPSGDEPARATVALAQLAGRRIEVLPWRGAPPRSTVVVVIATAGADPAEVEAWLSATTDAATVIDPTA